MMGNVSGRTRKILLWLLALAFLVFTASLFPEIRRHLPWFEDEPRPGQVPAERS